ncbi:DUF4326 domain-containing protein [Devosia sp. 2618]|uniref:DUF4326 domain-containing protein n=1 Tax=Devosia sp. 2618 TaxID=3156454 RepID=UPI00339837BD
MPDRIQLSRQKGWRMPLNTISVARPGKFGNPFTVASLRETGIRLTEEQMRSRVVDSFRRWLEGSSRDWMGPESDAARAAMLAALSELRGKNLACWCKLHGQPCHADVLLEKANA